MTVHRPPIIVDKSHEESNNLMNDKISFNIFDKFFLLPLRKNSNKTIKLQPLLVSQKLTD